jgi:hypothetical protein
MVPDPGPVCPGEVRIAELAGRAPPAIAMAAAPCTRNWLPHCGHFTPLPSKWSGAANFRLQLGHWVDMLTAIPLAMHRLAC